MTQFFNAGSGRTVVGAIYVRNLPNSREPRSCGEETERGAPILKFEEVPLVTDVIQ